MEIQKENEEKFREACCYGDLEVIISLVGQWVNIDAQHQINGWTGLHWACKRDQVFIVKKLISLGADACVENSLGQKAIALTSNAEIRQLLEKYDSNKIAKERKETQNGDPFLPEYPNSPFKFNDTNPTTPTRSQQIPKSVSDHSLETKDETKQETLNLFPEMNESVDASTLTVQMNGMTCLAPPALTDLSTSPVNLSKVNSKQILSDSEIMKLEKLCLFGDTDRETKNVRAIKDFVLKIRIAHTTDPDFIEIDLPTCDLNYSQLLLQCCKELAITPQSVERIRKLPNTRLRNDKDVRRLQHLEELELIVKGMSAKATPAPSAGGQPQQQARNTSRNSYDSITSFHNQTILY